MAHLLRSLVGRLPRTYHSSAEYWERRYAQGGTSGSGSYERLAEFKAEVVNDTIRRNGIQTVVDWGHGDGNQIRLFEGVRYVGFDVSETAVRRCRQLFAQDTKKSFYLASEYSGQRGDMSTSLDVIYHLTEDDVFESYMHRLFESSTNLVLIYSSNAEMEQSAPHVRHRAFTPWVESHMRDWTLARRISNRFPLTNDERTESFADFYLYRRK